MMNEGLNCQTSNTSPNHEPGAYARCARGCKAQSSFSSATSPNQVLTHAARAKGSGQSNSATSTCTTSTCMMYMLQRQAGHCFAAAGLTTLGKHAARAAAKQLNFSHLWFMVAGGARRALVRANVWQRQRAAAISYV